MTRNEIAAFGSEMMEKFPEQKDLIFIAVDDAMQCEDGDVMIQRLYDWIKDICNQ